MKIEILMATYNGEKYIREQIDSILRQSYCKWKLLIRDDGSRDNTVNIIKEYEKKDKRIKLLCDNKGNLGFVKNFEELILNSSEDFVMLTDQDDYWMENKIEKYIEVLNRLSDEEKKKEKLLIHSNSYICNDNLGIIREKFVDSKLAKNDNTNKYFFYYMVQGSTVMINREMINFCVPFSEKVTLHDRYFHLISELLGKRIFINKSLMKYRQHEGNEIGAKEGIIKKIIKKKYFDENDRELIKEIKDKYEKKLDKEKIEEINKYLKVTNRKINRVKRFCLSIEFTMKIRKRIFLLLKG